MDRGEHLAGCTNIERKYSVAQFLWLSQGSGEMVQSSPTRFFVQDFFSFLIDLQ